MAIILDGKKLRDEILADLKAEVDGFKTEPKLVVILVGDDPASKIYVNNKKKKAQQVGIDSEIINYPSDISETALLEKIKE